MYSITSVTIARVHHQQHPHLYPIPIHPSIHPTNLMLENSQTTLQHDILQDGSRRYINRTAFTGHNNDRTLQSHTSSKIDSAGNGQMIEFKYPRYARDSLFKIAELFEIRTQLDQRSGSKSIGIKIQLTMFQAVQIRLDQHQI